MGWFGWKKASKQEDPSSSSSSVSVPPSSKEGSKQSPSPSLAAETSLFEFGTANGSEDQSFTLVGYCPVSNDLEPCRWELLPAQASPSQAPVFRIAF